jgi:hypothetical protein
MTPTYGIHAARARLRALGGDLIRLPPRRHVPPNGRAYWIRYYRVDLPGAPLRTVDEYTARMLSTDATLARFTLVADPPRASPSPPPYRAS